MIVEVVFPYSVEVRRAKKRKHERIPLLGRTFADLRELSPTEAPVAFALSEVGDQPEPKVDMSSPSTIKIRSLDGRCHWPTIPIGEDLPLGVERWLDLVKDAENGHQRALPFPRFVHAHKGWPHRTEPPTDVKKIFSSKFEEAEAAVKRRVAGMFACDGIVHHPGGEPYYLVSGRITGGADLVVGGDDAVHVEKNTRRQAQMFGNAFRADRLEDATRCLKDDFRLFGQRQYRSIEILDPSMIRLNPTATYFNHTLKSLLFEGQTMAALPLRAWWGANTPHGDEEAQRLERDAYEAKIVDTQTAFETDYASGVAAAEKLLAATSARSLQYAGWAAQLQRVVERARYEIERYGLPQTLTQDDNAALDELGAVG